MNKEDILDMIEIIIGIAVFMIIVVSPLVAISYYGSCQEAKVFNELNGTRYTCSEFFWAGNQINTQVKTIRLTK